MARRSSTPSLLACAVAAVACGDGSVAPDPTGGRPPAAPPLATAPPPAVAPRADAGPDLFVALPANSLVLRASRYDTRPTADSVSWRKVSGPGSCRFVTSDTYRAEVRGLEKGTYEFEVAVTGQTGLTGRDTIAVHVLDGERVRAVSFTELRWRCPFSCSIPIHGLSRFVPDGALVRVLFKPAGAPEWVEVRAVWGDQYQYVYRASEGTLEVHADDARGLAELSISWVVP